MSAQHGLDKYVMRFPDGMRDFIKTAARNNGRSMNAEIVARITPRDSQLDRMEASLARLEVQFASRETDWRLIGDAPKDGGLFLALHKSGRVTVASVTRERTDWRGTGVREWDVEVIALNCSSARALSEFTHWMPLPSPPVR
jgi:hypothetical protein